MPLTPERLKELREVAGLHVIDLAYKTRLDTAYIYQLETGKRSPGPSTIRKYVAAGVMTRAEAANHLLGDDAA